MPKCNINDIVRFGICDKTIIKRGEPYDTTLCLRIIGYMFDSAGNPEYIAYLPRDEHHIISPSLMVGTYMIRNYNVQEKYLSVPGVYLRDIHIIEIVSYEDGAKCRVCSDFVYMAQPDNLDGTFVCRRCKLNPYI
jgi:hypothetical protein